MLENIIQYLSGLPWYWILISALFITLLENIFPPSPSDSVLIFLGTLVGLDAVGFIPLLISSTIGSTIGFIIMFLLGRYVGDKIIKSKKIFFITAENIRKPNSWLKKYGYYIIVFNRFMSGTRGVISFLAGIAEMNFAHTNFLAAISALVWNFILIYLGCTFGKNWREFNNYVLSYSKIILPIIIIIVIILIIRFFIKRKNN